VVERLRVFSHVGFFVSRRVSKTEARCFRSHFVGVFPERKRMMFYRVFSVGALAVAVASLLTLGSAVAQQRADTSVRATPQAAPDDVVMPACLEKLTLSQPQLDQIKEIVRDYDADLVAVWRQFGSHYLDTIRTEALLLTAIEDNLTESQRMQVREQRRKTAQHQKRLAGTDAQSNQTTARPASAIEEEIAIVGVSLTAEQEAVADQLQEKYLGRLRSLNRDIQGLHIRLVSLEADKLVEIENVLTEAQLLQLRESRQNAPIDQKATAERAAPGRLR
jgi:hypothetical protein